MNAHVPVSAMTGRNTPRRNRLSPLGTVVVALAALLQPAPLAAVSYEFDLTCDPATAVVAGTQVISFSRSEFGDEAVLLLLNNAGAVPNPHDNPLIEDLRYQSGFEEGCTRITGIVDAHGAEVPFEEFTPPAHGRLFTYPMPGLAVRLRLPPRDRYRLTVTFRTRLPALRAGDLTSRDGVFVQRFAWYPRLYPHSDRLTLPPIYAGTLGPLDYRRITIVEGVRPGAWGMAADAFVMLGSGAFNADLPSPERLGEGRRGGRRRRRGHLLPSFLSYLIVSLTLSIPAMILGETALSFLGIGIQPPALSWGALLQSAQNVRSVALAPWLFIPGLFIVVTVLAYNFVGDGLRAAADPYT